MIRWAPTAFLLLGAPAFGQSISPPGTVPAGQRNGPAVTACGVTAGCVNALNYSNPASGLVPGTSYVDEDDTPGLQTSLNAIANSTSLRTDWILPPATRPSGYYNICASYLAPPNNFQTKIFLHFRGLIRVLSGCNTAGMAVPNDGRTAMVYFPFNKSGGSAYNQQDYGQIYVDGLYADGENLVNFGIYNVATNIEFENITLRNVMGGAANQNANFYCSGGGSIGFMGKNLLGNYNDPAQSGSPFYGSGTYPAFGWWNDGLNSHGCHDSFISNIQVVNVGQAGFEDTAGDGMFYQAMQAYGNVAGSDTYGRPPYDYELTDNVVSLLASYWGGATVAGLHVVRNCTLYHCATATHALQITGGFSINGPPSGMVADYGANYIVWGFDFQNLVGTCITQTDSSGSPQTTPGVWFSALTSIGENTNCPLAVGFMPKSLGNLFVQTELAMYGRTAYSGTVPYSPSSGTTLTAGGEPAMEVNGASTLAALTIKLPFPNPTYPYQTYYADFWVPVTALTMQDSTGGTTDLRAMPTSIAASSTAGCHVAFTYSTAASKWGAFKTGTC
jgi:hypothetical protein